MSITRLTALFALCGFALAGCTVAPTTTSPTVPPPPANVATVTATPAAPRTATVSATTPAGSPSATSGATPTPTSPSIPAAPQEPVAAALWHALMDPDGEYAAFAAYDAVIGKYGQLEPYVTIRSAEERHIQALTRQLQRRGITVPANPYLGTIPAPDSLQQAAQAWADGEVANVALYDQWMAQVQSDANATKVFTNLRSSSQNSHLPLFQEAARNGGTLTPAQMQGR